MVRASKESLNGPLFQSVREALPRPSTHDFNTPTAGLEKDNSMLMQPAEAISAEDHPNMPPLNPKTNFRYA